jgi:hypothetical protein
MPSGISQLMDLAPEMGDPPRLTARNEAAMYCWGPR